MTCKAREALKAVLQDAEVQRVPLLTKDSLDKVRAALASNVCIPREVATEAKLAAASRAYIHWGTHAPGCPALAARPRRCNCGFERDKIALELALDKALKGGE